jgi:hypothetical protein
MRQSKVRILAAAVIGGIGMGLFASPAHAAETAICYKVLDGPVYRGYGCFDHDGDHIYAYDANPDGLRIVVEWYTNYGRGDECHDANGATNGEVDCNYDMKESGSLKFQVVARDGANGINQNPTGYTRWYPIGG